MSNIQPHYKETDISNSYLRRLRVSTEKGVCKLSSALLKIFIENFEDKVEELRNLRDKKMSEVNEYLTVRVSFEELGVSISKNLPRAKKSVENSIDFIGDKGCPCIILDSDTKNFKYIPLLKYWKIFDEGYCDVMFNDVLLDHILPNEAHGPCSPDIINEIENKNIYASYIYQEACSWRNLYNHGKNPFFIWSLSDVRKKFSFDNITLSNDGNIISTTNINKKMRIDNLLRIFNSAIKVINEFYDRGKIKFWLDLKVYSNDKKKPGRSPKNCFRFEIHKEKRNISSVSQTATQQKLQFDDYIMVDNPYMFRDILKGRNVPAAKIDKIIDQIKEKDAVENNFSERVLTKIRDIDSRNSNKDDKQWWYILRAALWRDFQLGEPGRNESIDISPSWPDNIDDKIKLMEKSYEICDRAIREHPELSLTQEKVISILGHEFRDYCINSDPPKPLRNWKDATELFFTLLKKPWFKNKLNYGTGDNQIHGQCQSDYSEEAMLRFYGGGECNGSV